MKKIFLITLLLLLVTGCSNSGLSNIRYKRFNEKIKDKDSFIVFIGQDNCSACETFSPTFKDVLNEYKIKAYYINLSKLSDDDKNNLKMIVSYNGTPTVAFIEKGVDSGVLTHISDGSITKQSIINRLEAFGYINKK